MLDLPTESTPLVASHADAETAFAVDEADDPLLETRPFLLVARTERILTAHVTALRSTDVINRHDGAAV